MYQHNWVMEQKDVSTIVIKMVMTTVTTVTTGCWGLKVPPGQANCQELDNIIVNSQLFMSIGFKGLKRLQQWKIFL